MIFQRLLKTLIDYTIAITLLIILSPLLIICSILIWVFDGRPILFVQQRPGYKEKIFKIMKFRTMSVKAEGNDLQRITTIGKFMRKTSLDELPQLLNILAGDLSLVGPRPLLVEYLPLYNQKQAKRHSMKPGITGWAQVNGRNAISWEQKFQYDIWYVENWSLALDFRILLLTIAKVFSQKDINANTYSTMEKFRGTPQ